MSNEQDTVTAQAQNTSHSAVGQINEFSKKSDWKAYIRKLRNYFDANDITSPNKKRAILLNVIGDEAVATLSALVSPLEPEVVPFDELIAKLTEHYEPQLNESVECFKFYNRFQNEQESIADFAIALRSLASTCNFTDLDKQLKVRLICGVRNETLQLRLLAEKNLTFQTALNIAKSFESAAQNLNNIRKPRNPEPTVNKILTTSNKPRKPESKSASTSAVSVKRPCFRCGDMHLSSNCPFIQAQCRYCKKVGHIVKACLTKKKKLQNPTSSIQTHAISTSSSTSVDESNIDKLSAELNSELLNLFNTNSTLPTTQPFLIQLKLNGVPCTFEVDSGASHSIIAKTTFHQLWPISPPQIEETNVSLRLWNQEMFDVTGSISVTVTFRNREIQNLRLLISEIGGRSLLGRDWFAPLGIDIMGIHNLQSSDNWIISFPRLFDGHTEAATCPPIRLQLTDTARPIFLRPRPVPLALRDKVEKALDSLVQQGTLVPTMYSEWATPIVPVLKSDGTMRVCMDYRITVNPALKTNTYPLPSIPDLLTNLSGGTVFTHLDLSQAYLQLPVDNESAEILTINTHKGLFKVHRLPFGLSASPGIFQKFMDTLLAGIPGVAVYLDDVVIAGNSPENHNQRVHDVLTRMTQAGLLLNKTKCQFNLTSIHFLGYIITSEGIRPTKDKVEAIHRAPPPKNKSELQAFLGLLNFYHQFLPNKATIAEPLHRLLNKGVSWHFGKKEQEAYEQTKNLIQSSDLLVHYNPAKKLFLTCDASPVGLGVVLSHQDDQQRHRAIAFASRTLSSAERNYAQTDREALAIIFGLSKFNKYIAGRHVIIRTDHKPLLGLLNPKKQIPQIISPRMLRWSLMMASYSYDLIYVPGSKIPDADALSRLPVLQTTNETFPDPVEVFMLETPGLAVSVEEIQSALNKDKILSCVYDNVLLGQQLDTSQNQELVPFARKYNELSIQKGCLLWGSRVVIPTSLRQRVLEELHALHPGIVAMKSLARCYAWWPGIDSDISQLVNTCVACQSSRHLPPKSLPAHWNQPLETWSRVHVDLMSLRGRSLLILVDATSKWVEVEPLRFATTESIIAALRRIFAIHGLPETIVTDNASVLASEEFHQFVIRNGMHHLHIAPYHPSSNGQAERNVQTVKDSLKRLDEDGDLETQLRRFLLFQHSTPIASCQKSPAELLFGRRLRTPLDALHPSRSAQHTASSKSTQPKREFKINDKVWMLNLSGPEKWLPARVVRRIGHVMYELYLEEGQGSHIRHIDQLRRRVE